LTNPLIGSTPNERWQTNQQTSYATTSSQTIVFSYYEQYSVSFNYQVVGSGGTPPQIAYYEFGTQQATSPNIQVWIDANSEYEYQNPLPDSTTSERWSSPQSTGVVTSASNYLSSFYHQYLVQFDYSIIDGGLGYSSPIVNFTAFGHTSSVIANASEWVDTDTPYSFPRILGGSTDKEKWIGTPSISGSITSSTTLTIPYQHQVYVTVQSADASGGVVSPPSGWYNASSSFELSANANSGWRFEDWTGTGAGSYFGVENTTSIVTLSPIIENAEFYPGLTVSDVGYGGVTYEWAGGKSTIGSGSRTLFVPVGTDVSLVATPSSMFFVFNGYTGAINSTEAASSIGVVSPITVKASFAPNYPVIGGLIGGVALVILGSVFYLRRRRGHERGPIRQGAGLRTQPSVENPLPDDWEIPGPHRKRKVALVAVACVILVLGLYYSVPALEKLTSTGPAPVWHTFQGVFESGSSGPMMVLGGACSLQGTLSVLGIPTSNIGPSTTVNCSFRGATYVGYVNTDCNLQATGTILSINDTLVPYLGCRVSYAPLQMAFPGLYTLTGKAKGSVPVYQGSNIIANLSLASNLKTESCSYYPATASQTNGFFACDYLGITYAASNMIQDCYVGTPIEVNGIPAPLGGCIADRDETFTITTTSPVIATSTSSITSNVITMLNGSFTATARVSVTSATCQAGGACTLTLTNTGNAATSVTSCSFTGSHGGVGAWTTSSGSLVAGSSLTGTCTLVSADTGSGTTVTGAVGLANGGSALFSATWLS
jgi:hypothetical protein